ncbi:arrestin red cell-like [Watersipora subatra]|uniref:arrestin red cell-like n=1 Tax=Watersipora subatra TaxID=2589382 RepID=UPI00355AE530
MAANGESTARPSTQSSTRVFKKASPNSKITTYLGKRDFVDSGSNTDIVDGVVLVDPEYVKDRKVFTNILAAFRYGREDLDVLGLTFRKDLFVSTVQVYPPLEENEKPLTPLQSRLIKKLGANAHPFSFDIPENTPSSVTLQPGPEDTGKPCGVDYELKTWVAENDAEKPHKRSTVRLAIRKLTYAPEESAPQPRAECTKDFMMSSGKVKVEASLDKEKYYHGEKIAVNLTIDNNSNKKVKKIAIQVIQVSDIILFSKASYKCSVAEMESESGMPVLPSQSGFCKVYTICPSLEDNRDKRGLALDGKLKHEDTNLASSTIIRDNVNRENLGIVVQYRVKVKLVMSLGASDVILEMPFTLTHPKPVTPPPSRPVSASADAAVDMNLIELEEGNDPALVDDDIIFEDFARLRLKGAETEEADA